MASMDALLDATYQAEQHHFWFRGFRKFVRPLVAEATSRISNPRILDCGCGTGANMVMLGAFGSTFGFDVTWRGLQHAREYGQSRIAQADATHIPFGTGQFDLVTSFDVLYCLEEKAEQQALAEIFRVLRPGGALIVNVAALGILHGSHSIFGGEVRRSTRPRLRQILQRAGFTIGRLTYTNAVLFPLMLAVRSTQRLMGLASREALGREIDVPPAPINAILSTALSLEAEALRFMNMPIGSSLLCLAWKPE
ncbi:MAG: class I SAM-dependent methyltransferase [Acidimicrobiia bacterium]